MLKSLKCLLGVSVDVINGLIEVIIAIEWSHTLQKINIRRSNLKYCELNFLSNQLNSILLQSPYLAPYALL